MKRQEARAVTIDAVEAVCKFMSDNGQFPELTNAEFVNLIFLQLQADNLD